MPIFANTPPDVARARIQAWQREKELKLFEDLSFYIRYHSNNGLELKRVARTLSILAKAFEKVGRP